MEKKHIITIAGKPGSGKSATSKRLASTFGFNHYSSGDLFRSLAKERGINVNEINKLAETEKDIDHKVDAWLQKLGTEENNFVVDSRMAWHWMPYSFRVYLDLDLTVAAKRILKGIDPVRREAEHIPEDPEIYAALLSERLESESKRYMDLYQQNPYETSNYDIVVDTNKHNLDEVVTIVSEAFTKWQKQNS